MSRTTLFLLAVGVAPGTACELGLPAGAEPHRELNFLDMADQPKLKPQRPDLLGARPNGMIPPPAGAVAVDEYPYPFTQEQAELAAAANQNPLAATPEVIAHGKFIFEHVCITCHGPQGAGDGHLTKKFPEPPSWMTQKVRDWPDGRIFHIAMRGQGSMPAHGKQLEPDDIWSVILFIRELQQSLPVAPPPATGVPPATLLSAPPPPVPPTPTPPEPTPQRGRPTPAPSEVLAPPVPATPELGETP